MIRASFGTDKNGLLGFEISGHSGYSEEGSDIICAAVSAMADLVIHLAVDIYKDGGKVFQDDKSASLAFYPEKTESSVLVGGLYDELLALSNEYPKNVSVKKTDGHTK